MREIVGTFLRGEGGNDQADSTVKSLNCSLSCLAQKLFHFAEGQFDRIEIRRVLGQIPQCCAHGFDRLPNTWSLVSTKIVRDHDIVMIECRSQTLLDIGD